MKLSVADLGLLRWNLLAVGGALLLGSILLYGSNRYDAKAHREYDTAKSAQDTARRQLSSTQEDRMNLSVYADAYAAFASKGLIGEGQRLDWMEGLEALRRMHPVEGFSYHIGPQKPYIPPYPLDQGNFDILYSEMTLEFDLLHEAQLLEFFAALNNHLKGRYQLEGCTLKRQPDDNRGIRLHAECRGGWITLKHRNPQP